VPVVAIALSFDYDMTQPCSEAPSRLSEENALVGPWGFALFVGFGLGSLGFGALLEFGFVLAFSILRARN
jgi:hypothetical protein